MRHAHTRLTEQSSGGMSTRPEEVTMPPQRGGILLGEDGKVVELYPPVPTRKLHGIAKIAGAKTRFTLEEPVNLEDRIDEVALINFNGFGGTKSAYDKLRGKQAARGKRAVTLRPVRSRGLKDFDPTSYFPPAELASKMAYAVMKELGEEEYDIAGHSLGGSTVANVAEYLAVVKKKPEMVRSAIFVASVGLDQKGVSRPVSAARRLRRGGTFLHKEAPSVAWEAIKDKDVRIALASLHYLFRNVPRTVTEGLTAASTDIHERVLLLGEHGIKTAALQFRDDCFFPVEDVTDQAGHIFDIYRIFGDPKANHAAPQILPDQVAEAEIAILAELHPRPKPATAPDDRYLSEAA